MGRHITVLGTRHTYFMRTEVCVRACVRSEAHSTKEAPLTRVGVVLHRVRVQALTDSPILMVTALIGARVPKHLYVTTSTVFASSRLCCGG